MSPKQSKNTSHLESQAEPHFAEIVKTLEMAKGGAFQSASPLSLSPSLNSFIPEHFKYGHSYVERQP